MNMFARFDKNAAMTLQDIKKTKRYGRTDGRTDNVKTVPTTKFAGGIDKLFIVIIKNVGTNKPNTTGLLGRGAALVYPGLTSLFYPGLTSLFYPD